MTTMRTKSLAQIEAQIAKLTAEAESIRAREVADVVARLKVDIAHYGLTAADLGLDSPAKTGRARRNTKRSAPAEATAPTPLKARRSAKSAGTAAAKPSKKNARKAAKPAGKAKYSDGTNSWTGVGKRPNWFKAAIDAGKTPEDLLV